MVLFITLLYLHFQPCVFQYLIYFAVKTKYLLVIIFLVLYIIAVVADQKIIFGKERRL
jgi:hypothetical protein